MDRPPQETTPVDDLYTRLDQIETRLIEQEHRVLSNVKNVIKHGWSDNKKRKRAAWLAVIRTFLFSRNSVVVISSLSIISVIGAYLAWQANNILTQQNELFELQNERIIQQVNLEEANRRSSLIFLMSNIMDKVDEELKEDPNNDKIRNISPQLIGRIAALSQAMRPYRYLSGDTLIGKPLSPERGQLLTALAKTKFDSTAYQEIYRNVKFQDADLQYAQLELAYLSGAHLGGADLREANLSGADLSEAILNGADLRWADLDKANLNRAELLGAELNGAYLIGADLSEANLSEADLSEANLRDVALHEADLYRTDLSGTDLRWVDLSGAELSETNLRWVDLIGANLENAQDLTFEQLSTSQSLFQCQGIPNTLLTRLKKEKPELFEKPKWWDGWMIYKESINN